MSTPSAPLPHDADRQLVRAALEGSAEARLRFAQRMACVPRMLAARNQRLGSRLSPADLEDLVQDTLVSIWRRLDTYRGMASLESWAWRFCQHHLANRLRARRRAPAVLSLTEGELGPEQRLELYDGLHQALARLDERDALVVRLRHFGALGFPEIGERLGIAPNTAKSRYYRGLGRLRELLAPLRRKEAL